jgi:uncharacterized membrane protein
MNFGPRNTILNKAVEDWQQRGLIDAGTATTLKSDIATSNKERSLGSIVILLAIICFGFAAITFVASNWEHMGRLQKVVLIFATMWAAWGGAAIADAKNHNWIAQTLVLLACSLFGAGIMLNSQIYHIQGAPEDATWMWAVGAIVGAVLTRSIPALALATILFTVAEMIAIDPFGRGAQASYFFIAWWGLCAAASWWMKSRFAGHVVTIAICIWASAIALQGLAFDSHIQFMFVYSAGYILLVAALVSLGTKQVLRGFETTAVLYLLAALSVLFFVVQIDGWAVRMFGDLATMQWAIPIVATAVICAAITFLGFGLKSSTTYDTIIACGFFIATSIVIFAIDLPIAFEALMLGGSIWMIRMGWRTSHLGMRILGFASFAVAMLIIYFETVGSLIGTAGFYLGAGIVLLVGTWVASKLKPSEVNAP